MLWQEHVRNLLFHFCQLWAVNAHNFLFCILFVCNHFVRLFCLHLIVAVVLFCFVFCFLFFVFCFVFCFLFFVLFCFCFCFCFCFFFLSSQLSFCLLLPYFPYIWTLELIRGNICTTPSKGRVVFFSQREQKMM